MAAAKDNPNVSLDAATRSMLTGLSTLHGLTIALDDQARIRWVSDRLGLLSGREGEFVGRPATDLAEALVARVTTRPEVFGSRNFLRC